MAEGEGYPLATGASGAKIMQLLVLKMGCGGVDRILAYVQ